MLTKQLKKDLLLQNECGRTYFYPVEGGAFWVLCAGSSAENKTHRIGHSTNEKL